MPMKVQQVNITAVSDNLEEALNDRSLLTCSFCGKSSTMPSVSRTMIEKLSRPQELFCRFCLRNNLTSKNNRHILVLTFRSVFGYLYYNNYKPKEKDKKKLLCYSQLKDFVRVHEDAGMTNPVFKYDSESFLWFVDFEKVGRTGRKIPVSDVHKTVVNILSCFNFSETVPGFRMHTFYKKYAEAIDTFYSDRSRPEGRKVLCPTFQHCGISDTKELPLEKTREFSPQDMVK